MIGKMAVLGVGALAALGFALSGGTAHAAPGAPGGAPKPEPQPPAPKVDPKNLPPDLLKLIQQAKDTGNPAVLLNTADMLEAMGLGAVALDLRTLAKEITVATGQAPVQVQNNPVPQGAPASPIPQPPPQAPPIVPNLPVVLTPVTNLPPLVITAAPDDPGKALAATLTANLQGVKRRGQENKGLVGAFQEQEILKGTYSPLAVKFFDKKPNTADQLYGAVSALLVASYGIVPVRPMYWSSNAATAGKQKAMFTQLMLAKAASDPTRATEWSAASNVANS